MIFVGDDWAEDHHDIHIMNTDGTRLVARRLPEGLAGISTLHELVATHCDDPGQVVVGIKTADVDAAAKAVEDSGGGIVKGPYDDAHERRAVVYDNKGNGLVFYSPLKR